jgi:Vitamin K-dependent gamma-carboxylase
MRDFVLLDYGEKDRALFKKKFIGQTSSVSRIHLSQKSAIMTYDLAITYTSRLLGWAYLWQGIEMTLNRYRYPSETWSAWIFMIAALFLLLGSTSWILLGLLGLACGMLHRFSIYNGPYNGGSDRLGALLIFSTAGALLSPKTGLSTLLVGYAACQTALSYFIAGWVKIINPEWRQGQALANVFRISFYPATQSMRALADQELLIKSVSWAVIILELVFPLALLSPTWLTYALFMTGAFHLSNAYFLGLNRFFWIWIASYPYLLWLSSQVLSALHHATSP